MGEFLSFGHFELEVFELHHEKMDRKEKYFLAFICFPNCCKKLFKKEEYKKVIFKMYIYTIWCNFNVNNIT